MSGFYGYALTALIAYAIGNLNFSIIFSRLFYNKDIRNYGSGNAGSTNTFRNFGPWMGTLVLICDIAKGVGAVLLGKYIIFGGYNLPAAYLAGLCAAIGHIYPALFKFKGGKGVATIAGMMFAIDWRMSLVGLVFFLVVLLVTGFMSLASLTMAACSPILSFIFSFFIYRYTVIDAIWVSFSGAVMGGIIVFTHRENIKRLYKGTESKIIKWRKKNG